MMTMKRDSNIEQDASLIQYLSTVVFCFVFYRKGKGQEAKDMRLQ